MTVNETLDKPERNMPDGTLLGGAVSHGSGGMSCGAHGGNRPEIKLGWGGARPGAGRKPKAPEPEQPIGQRWYAVQTYPQMERTVAVELTRQHWENYFPLQEVLKRDRVTPSIVRRVTVPLLTGYLFVRFDRDGRTWGTIRANNPGVIGVVKADGFRPTPVPEAQMERFRAIAATKLSLVDPKNEARLPGCLVRVLDGPLIGYSGVVQACDGLETTVDVAILGRVVPVRLRWDQVGVE